MSETSKKFELTMPMAVLISGAFIAAAIYFSNGSLVGSGAEAVEAATFSAVPEPSAEDHWRGSPDAPTVIVEYSDFQCPYCSLFHPTLERIVAESSGEVAWVYRHLPLTSLHPEAHPAAVASECVFDQLGDDGFWAFADRMFADQSRMNDAYYAQVAQELGADPGTFAACVASGKNEAKVDRQTNDAANAGARGTPFSVIVTGGKQYPFSGALPYNQVTAILSAATGQK